MKTNDLSQTKFVNRIILATAEALIGDVDAIELLCDCSKDRKEICGESLSSLSMCFSNCIQLLEDSGVDVQGLLK